jgi:hypothetical protein
MLQNSRVTEQLAAFREELAFMEYKMIVQAIQRTEWTNIIREFHKKQGRNITGVKNCWEELIA